MINISNRLKCVADTVDQTKKVADIGCDHAYVSIYLVENHIAEYVIAMDVRSGPLAIAKQNIEKEMMQDCIETRLSDGLQKLEVHEVNSVVIAGMGGPLMIRLLSDSKKVVDELDEMVLQPQSDVTAVRRYLVEQGYQIVKEQMLIDAEKYYCILKVSVASDKKVDVDIYEAQKAVDFRYGAHLLRQRDETLKQYLQKEYDELIKIKDKLATSEPTDKVRQAICANEEQIALNREAYGYYEV